MTEKVYNDMRCVMGFAGFARPLHIRFWVLFVFWFFPAYGHASSCERAISTLIRSHQYSEKFGWASAQIDWVTGQLILGKPEPLGKLKTGQMVKVTDTEFRWIKPDSNVGYTIVTLHLNSKGQVTRIIGIMNGSFNAENFKGPHSARQVLVDGMTANFSDDIFQFQDYSQLPPTPSDAYARKHGEYRISYDPVSGRMQKLEHWAHSTDPGRINGDLRPDPVQLVKVQELKFSVTPDGNMAVDIWIPYWNRQVNAISAIFSAALSNPLIKALAGAFKSLKEELGGVEGNEAKSKTEVKPIAPKEVTSPKDLAAFDQFESFVKENGVTILGYLKKSRAERLSFRILLPEIEIKFWEAIEQIAQSDTRDQFYGIVAFGLKNDWDFKEYSEFNSIGELALDRQEAQEFVINSSERFQINSKWDPSKKEIEPIFTMVRARKGEIRNRETEFEVKFDLYTYAKYYYLGKESDPSLHRIKIVRDVFAVFEDGRPSGESTPSETVEVIFRVDSNRRWYPEGYTRSGHTNIGLIMLVHIQTADGRILTDPFTRAPSEFENLRNQFLIPSVYDNRVSYRGVVVDPADTTWGELSHTLHWALLENVFLNKTPITAVDLLHTGLTLQREH